ncbi:MAG: tetratricopeptide repeat protein [candidate division Zixibacteria bacterium]|nr:tetratricopeptide repeat protein [candidate division Zixibacteria bacterium]
MNVPMKRLLYIVAATLSLTLTASAQFQAPPDSGSNPIRITLTNITGAGQNFNPLAYNAYVNAILLEQMGDLWSAAESYKIALAYYPESYELGYSLAEVYYRLREPQKALTQLAALKQMDVSGYRLQAACYQALGNPERALGAFHKLAELEPDNAQAFSFLATAYRARNDIDSTVWAYENLVRIDPLNFRVWNEMGRIYAQRGETDRAKAAFQRSLDANLSPENSMAIAGLGELYVLGSQLDSAEIVISRGLTADPDNILLHRQMVALYIDRDSFDLALPHAKRVVELAPLDRPSVRRLGLLYFRLDSLDQADSIFTDLVRGGERAVFNHYYLGHIAILKRQFERARDEFQMVAQFEDTASQSWIDLAFAYHELKQPENELRSYTDGLARVRSSRDSLRLRFAIGSYYERLGKVEDAISMFESILRADSNHHQALNYLGYMLADRGERLDYARNLIERAVQLDPSNAAYLDSYGWVFYRLGQYDEALKQLEKAAEMVSDATVFDHLGDAYKAVKLEDKARLWWQRALDIDSSNTLIREKLQR